MTDTYDVTNPDKPKIVKDPNATLDYTFDWTQWLTDISDSIISATISVVPADDASTLNIVQQTVASPKVIAWLSGGVAGKTYQVTCHITTASTPARVDDRSIFIKVKER